MSPRRAKGLDHWGPGELKALPHTYLEGLADILNRVEQKGEWPQELRQVMVALNPTPGAEREGQLRPIGLLPTIYRLRMAVRKPATKAWAENIHGGRNASALELAWKTGVQDEQAIRNGTRKIVALLDCSKCYERVPHKLAGQIAGENKCPAQIVDLVMDMYAALRRVKVHNVVSDTATGTNGLAAGCAYAKDILEGYLKDIEIHVNHGGMGIYVDGVTLSIEGQTASEAARTLQEDLTTTKDK